MVTWPSDSAESWSNAAESTERSRLEAGSDREVGNASAESLPHLPARKTALPRHRDEDGGRSERASASRRVRVGVWAERRRQEAARKRGQVVGAISPVDAVDTGPRSRSAGRRSAESDVDDVLSRGGGWIWGRR